MKPHGRGRNRGEVPLVIGAIVRLAEDIAGRQWHYGSFLGGAVLAEANSFGLVLNRYGWLLEVANPVDHWVVSFCPNRILTAYGRLDRPRLKTVRITAGGRPDCVYELSSTAPFPGRPHTARLAAFERWLREGEHLRARPVRSLVLSASKIGEIPSSLLGNESSLPREGLPPPVQPGELLYDIVQEVEAEQAAERRRLRLGSGAGGQSTNADTPTAAEAAGSDPPAPPINSGDGAAAGDAPPGSP